MFIWVVDIIALKATQSITYENSDLIPVGCNRSEYVPETVSLESYVKASFGWQIGLADYLTWFVN